MRSCKKINIMVYDECKMLLNLSNHTSSENKNKNKKRICINIYCEPDKLFANASNWYKIMINILMLFVQINI